MRAVAYLRVSSQGQVDGHSLDAQARLFDELCKNRGWEAVGVYREEGKSAHVEHIRQRPVFRQLLEDAGRDRFDVVVVHTLDRWSRNLKVTLESLGPLSKHGIGLVSITEDIDYSTPQGKLFTQMLGSFAEYFSESLATHVRKGQGQRAAEGRHLGGIPFGYESCWTTRDGQRQRLCDPEHPGGVHSRPEECAAVADLFKRYAVGNTTTATLAAWLNEQGFRTRNTKKLPDAEGHLVGGARFFTNASVRSILHNPFYAGFVVYRGERRPGAHEAVISPELFEAVQIALKKNSGRSETLSRRKSRSYLLKGLIRCAHCGFPLWAQTYRNGNRYYREQYGTRSHGHCPAHGGSIPCHVPDEQIGRIVGAIELGPDWLEQVLARIGARDEAARIQEERTRTNERLRRLGLAYVDGLYSDADYQRQKRSLITELESLVVPEVDAAAEAGRLICRLPELWNGATPEERRDLLTTMLDGVYVDLKETRTVVALKPKAPFKAVFRVATAREGSGVTLLQQGQPPAVWPGADPSLCSWWRRGRIGLRRKHNQRLNGAGQSSTVPVTVAA